MIEIVAPGPLATVQDLGRPGYAALGVGPGGAADRAAHRLANRLVGNRDTAATVEATYGGLQVRSAGGLLVAVTGAVGRLDVDGREAATHCPVALPARAVLTVHPPRRGLRSYLAVRGGLDVPAVLGSRGTDLLSGLGPEPLAVGDRLPVGAEVEADPVVDLAPVAEPAGEPVLALWPGPRRDWFTDQAWSQLLTSAYTVSPDSNRIATRLDGAVLPRAVDGELPSEPVVAGAVQVPSSGRPLIFGADHPVTGGYPVIAVLTRTACDQAAQLRPGQLVRFTALDYSRER